MPSANLPDRSVEKTCCVYYPHRWDTQEESLRYQADEKFSNEDDDQFGLIYENNNSWDVEALGQGLVGGAQRLVHQFT
jgi:stress response protein SCP2